MEVVQRQQPVKICRVCGDNAHAFNFSGLPSCHSCRVFFYRNAPKHEKLKCLKTGNCALDFVTRKCCSYCRLQRCFEIGMKLKTTSKINPAIKSDDDTASNDSLLVDILKAKNDIDNKSDETKDDEAIDETDTDCLPKSPQSSLELNTYELAQIEEIRSYSSHFPEENTLPIATVTMNVAQSFNLSSFYARRGVKYCKNIPFFKALSKADQLRLLKPSMFDSMTIRCAFFYKKSTDTFMLYENEQGTKAVEVQCWCHELQQNGPLAEENKRVTAILCDEMENDTTIRSLLTIISLVKPSEETFPEIIRYHYYVYCHLLKRYLQHKYQCSEKAQSKYTTLMNIITKDFAVLRENLRLILLEVGIDNLAEIIVEAMSLQELLLENY